ncbi:MAG: GlxA family transcriptional regulator [Pseudomarimonas sp.]
MAKSPASTIVESPRSERTPALLRGEVDAIGNAVALKNAVRTAAIAREPRLFTLGVLAMDGVILSSLAGPIDTLRIAQKLAFLHDPTTSLRFTAQVIGARQQPHLGCSGGLRLEGVVCGGNDPDVLLVPGFMHGSADDIIRTLNALGPEIELIRAMHARGVTIASTCCGAFILAEAGLLDGRRATVSWWLDAVFRERYPRVQLDADAMLIEDGSVATTGGSSAVINYVLRLIGRVGGEDLAQLTSRLLLVDRERNSQAPYVSMALRERPRHTLTEKAERYINEALHGEISVGVLAEHCGTSERSLHRHFRAHFGVSPLEHIQHLRVERAKAMLESTLLSFDEIVGRCGYSDVSSFRKLFKRATTMTPQDYRERFRLRPH